MRVSFTQIRSQPTQNSHKIFFHILETLLTMVNISNHAVALMLVSVCTPLLAGAEHYHIPLSNETVHWGYFSKTIDPVLTIDSGEKVVVEVRRKY